MDIPLRFGSPTRRPAKPYGVTAHYDQLRNRDTQLRFDNGLEHADG